jgi:putative NADH-flavin reductase
MNLLVLGASGGVGQQAVEQAAARGHDVVALVRRLPLAVAPPSVRVIKGDVLSAITLDRVMPGRDGVVCCLGIRRAHAANPWSRILSPLDFIERAVRGVAESMERHGIKRLVAISAAGVAESAQRMNRLLRLLFAMSNVGVSYRDLANMEASLARTSLDWLAVRPVTLTNSHRAEVVETTSRYALFSTISKRAVASWMLDRMEDSSPVADHTPMICATAPRFSVVSPRVV